MADIITRCPKHGVINCEPTPMSITYVGFYRPGQMRYCPYCGKQTTIEWPEEENNLKACIKACINWMPPWEDEI